MYSRTVSAELFSNAQTIGTGVIGQNGSPMENYTYIVEDWRRNIKIDSWGGISATDKIVVINNSNASLRLVFFYLPPNATAITVQDIFGTYGSTSLTITNHEAYVSVRIFLKTSLAAQNRTSLLAAYSLPSSAYIKQSGWQDCTLNVSLSKPSDWYVEEFTLTVTLPEGAEYRAASITPSLVQKSGFSVSVEYEEANFTQVIEPNISLQYQYFILWAIFRPALWTGIAVAFFGAVFFTRRRLKTTPMVVAAAPFSSGLLKDFVNLYEERRRLRSDLESMEAQTERGKLSRRKYRLRKSSVDDHISRLDKDLSQLSTKIAAASERYVERMRSLEKAEKEIETLKINVERAEARFLRREITAEARRKMLDEYSRMKERVENTIEETILRLKEEIH
jgi:hypothetical protein